MSTTETAIIPSTPSTPSTAPVRKSILRPSAPDERGPEPFDGWRGQAPTEELPSVTSRCRRARPARRTAVRRHLRAALVGTLLAIVAIAGLSAYAAQGIADARQAALCQARITCK